MYTPVFEYGLVLVCSTRVLGSIVYSVRVRFVLLWAVRVFFVCFGVCVSCLLDWFLMRCFGLARARSGFRVVPSIKRWLTKARCVRCVMMSALGSCQRIRASVCTICVGVFLLYARVDGTRYIVRALVRLVVRFAPVG